jgi:IclR family pca regulon transcriptional regulator
MFALTPRVLRLAQSYMHSARLPRIVQPELHKLAHGLKEASAAGVLDGHEVVSIAATSAGRLVSSTLQTGTRVPAYCTSNGRVLLASLDAQALDDRITPHRLRSLTPHTIVQPDRLRAELVRVRTQGYAVVDQELEIGLRTVAVPLRNYRGDTVAAMNVSVHATRMTVGQLVQTALPPLLQAQAQLRQLL